MHATTVAIDLAKDVFELAFADAAHRVVERKRLTRRAFSRVLDNHAPLHVVMEACGSAHYWGRRFERLGCHRSPQWSHSMIGVMEPADDRRNGATS